MPDLGSFDADVIAAAFDREWLDFCQGKLEAPPRIDQFAKQCGIEHDQGQLLLALIDLDFRHRWRGTAKESEHSQCSSAVLAAVGGSEVLGRCPRLEDYVRLFPEIGPIDQLPSALI